MRSRWGGRRERTGGRGDIRGEEGKSLRLLMRKEKDSTGGDMNRRSQGSLGKEEELVGREERYDG